MKYSLLITLLSIKLISENSVSEAKPIYVTANDVLSKEVKNKKKPTIGVIVTECWFSKSIQNFMPSPATDDEYPDPIETSGQFEGDILLSPLEERNAVRNEYLKWPEGRIPYTLPVFFGVLGRIAVAIAANEFASRTCVKLVPRTNETDYVSIIRGGGCYSMVGRVGGKQELSLAEPCQRVAIIEHEFMHALGFWHEQSRTDRDKYVTVRWQNIVPGAENNFQKYSTYVQQTLEEEYDYGSVMHYSQNAFSKNSRPTIVPKTLFAGIIMGQRIGFSPTDLRKINKLYGCTEYL